MTKEMKDLFDNLNQVKVKNVTSAYDYLGEKMNDMYMNDTLDFEMSTGALKRIYKDVKSLKKHYKGKISINPANLYRQYQEGTQERFFLECLVRLIEYNKL